MPMRISRPAPSNAIMYLPINRLPTLAAASVSGRARLTGQTGWSTIMTAGNTPAAAASTAAHVLSGVVIDMPFMSISSILCSGMPREKKFSTGDMSIPAIIAPPGSWLNMTMNRIMTSMPPMYIMIWSRAMRSARSRMNRPATPMKEAIRKMPERNMLMVVAMPRAPATAITAKTTNAPHWIQASGII